MDGPGGARAWRLGWTRRSASDRPQRTHLKPNVSRLRDTLPFRIHCFQNILPFRIQDTLRSGHTAFQDTLLPLEPSCLYRRLHSAFRTHYLLGRGSHNTFKIVSSAIQASRIPCIQDMPAGRVQVRHAALYSLLPRSRTAVRPCQTQLSEQLTACIGSPCRPAPPRADRTLVEGQEKRSRDPVTYRIHVGLINKIQR